MTVPASGSHETRRWSKGDSNRWSHVRRRRFSEYLISPPRAAHRLKADPLRPEGDRRFESPLLQGEKIPKSFCAGSIAYGAEDPRMDVVAWLTSVFRTLGRTQNRSAQGVIR